jgi:thiamine-phosphate pyrophosphorylase
MKTTLYRIIDANFNRAREALRVMEEYCRFGLNNAGLSGRAKQMRHRLCETIGRFDAVKLLCSRDTAGDVGRELKVDGQLRRMSLEDCFTAGAKRASEALRALAEACQAIEPEAAVVMEGLRFGVYALEKDTVLYAGVRGKLEAVRLYVLINAGAGISEDSVLKLAIQCLAGGADCLQLRAKNIHDNALLSLAKDFVGLCRKSGAVSIINDRTDIAILAEADGVHLGQDEISAQDARRLAKGPLIVGVSTHNMEELQRAIASGCDYVGVGPAFASPTKPDVHVAGLDYLKLAAKMLEGTGIYATAIGGIDEGNAGQVLAAGIRCAAVSSCVSGAASPEDYCKALKRRLLSS